MADMNVVLVGPPGVGKSSLLRRLTRGCYASEYVATIGVEYDQWLAKVDYRSLRVSIWDVSGAAVFDRLARKYMKRADAVMFVYDVTNGESLRALQAWLHMLAECACPENMPKMAVGNKLDGPFRQVVGSYLGKQFAIPEGMLHMETSARSGLNVNRVFQLIISDIFHFRAGCARIPSSLPHYRSTTDPVTAGYNIDDDVSSSPRYTHQFRLMLLGGVRVGKTSLAERFCRGTYTPQYHTTAGIEYVSRSVLIDGEYVKLRVWDTSGDDVYETLRHECYETADGFILVYDVTQPDTFTRAERLMKELSLHGQSDAPKVIVGNKCDLIQKRLVDGHAAQFFAAGWRVLPLETSARNGDNVDAPFIKLAALLMRQLAHWKRVYNFI